MDLLVLSWERRNLSRLIGTLVVVVLIAMRIPSVVRRLGDTHWAALAVVDAAAYITFGLHAAVVMPLVGARRTLSPRLARLWLVSNALAFGPVLAASGFAFSQICVQHPDAPGVPDENACLAIRNGLLPGNHLNVCMAVLFASAFVFSLPAVLATAIFAMLTAANVLGAALPPASVNVLSAGNDRSLLLHILVGLCIALAMRERERHERERVFSLRLVRARARTPSPPPAHAPCAAARRDATTLRLNPRPHPPAT